MTYIAWWRERGQYHGKTFEARADSKEEALQKLKDILAENGKRQVDGLLVLDRQYDYVCERDDWNYGSYMSGEAVRHELHGNLL